MFSAESMSELQSQYQVPAVRQLIYHVQKELVYILQFPLKIFQ